MPAIGRLVALASCAAVAVLGLALGAQSQKEFVLESDLTAQGELASQGAAGNLVILTALPVALGVSGGALLLSRRRVRERLGPGAVLLVAVYAAVLLGQSMWPFYVAVIEYRYATLSNSLLAANLQGIPSVALPPLALLLGAILAAGWAMRRLLGTPQAPTQPRDWLRRQAAATLLAAPFLAVLAAGTLRVLLRLPDDEPGLAPAFVVLPGILLGCLALGALAALKTWSLGTYVRNARLAASVQDTWQALGRIESSLVAVLGGLALAASFLPATAMPELELGRVLGFTVRSHTQMAVLLGIPLAPLLAQHRAIQRRLAEEPVHAGTLDDTTDPVARAAVAGAVASLAGAAAGTFLGAPALWAWMLALAPAAGAAFAVAGPRASAPHVLLAAFTLWAIGNTVRATYAGDQGTAVLDFTTPPGLLALWRTLGAVVAATALARLALLLGGGRARLALAVGSAAALAAIALLEMPLTAWLLNRPGVDAIAVGSVVASLDPPVRAILHTVAAVLAVAAALLVALLHRPDWFGRAPRRPLAIVRPKAAKAAPGKAAGAPA